MSNRMKYIVVEGHLCDKIYIFSEADEHWDIANKIDGTVLSAGFVGLASNGLFCWGKSVSLDVGSRPEADTKLLRREFGVDDI